MNTIRMGGALLVAAALAFTGALASGFATAAASAESAKDASTFDLAEVTVTARRRDESIVDVPLAITVVGAQQLSKLDITTTQELANYVPGLEFNDFTPGYSRNDRGGARALVFRGLALGLGSAGLGVTGAGGMFLDGAAVVGNEVPGGMDIGAVEVLRGPQSVYFGRAAMTGAVSYRTKAIPDSWKADTEAELAQRNTRRYEASAAGPLIQGLLGARITGLTESNDGYVTNQYNNGSTSLGARSRNSISGTLEFTPTDRLEAKGYVNFFQDDDGPAATAFIPAQDSSYQVLTGIPGGARTNPPAGCPAAAPFPISPPCQATRYTFIGEIPDRQNSINYLNTTIPANFAGAIFASPLLNGTSFKDKVGLQRDVLASHFIVNYKISDYLKFQSITGYHTNVTLQAADGISQPVTIYDQYNQYFYTITNKSKDFSQEVRLSSDPARQFSWTVGANYVDAFARVEAIVAFLNQTPGSGAITTFTPIPQNITSELAKTTGIFGGMYYKLLDNKLTLSAEGRFQQDKRGNEQQTINRTVLLNLSNTFNSFNPRISADYDVGGNRKVYASFATGTRPGGFNGTLKTYLDRNNPILTAQLEAALGVTGLTYDEEKLRIWELGFKGNFPDGNGFFDVNAYVGKLSNQQVSFGALIPILGFTVTATSNIGETTIHGVEWQGSYRFTPEWSLATTAAWNYAERNKYTNTAGYPLLGTTDYSGAKMPNAPEFSGSAVLSYERPVVNDWQWYSNADLVYRGKQYVDNANLAYIKGRTQIDLRSGFSKNQVRIEGYVLNLFDNQDYTGGNVATDFGGSGDATGLFSAKRYAFFGAWAPPRQVGVRLDYSF